MSSYADLHRFFHERWDIACDALAVYPDKAYKAEEAFYRSLAAAFASLADDEVPWDDLRIRWAIADVLLEAIVSLVPEAIEEVSE
jgi:hypothetical protein